MIIAAILITITLAGAAWTGYLLRRDAWMIWHPGDALPAVPDAAPAGLGSGTPRTLKAAESRSEPRISTM